MDGRSSPAMPIGVRPPLTPNAVTRPTARSAGRPLLRFPALAILLLWALCGCASQQNCALVALAGMPLDAGNNLMLVTAGIAGQPVRLLVDTGAERTILTEAAVKRLGLGRDDHHTRSVGIGGFSADWDARVPGLDLGGTRFPIDRVAVGHFAIRHLFPEQVDGLLGADILLAFDLDIDIPDHRLTLYRVRRCPTAVPPWPAVEVQGVGARRDRMLVPFTVDGAKGMAIFDTGAQASAISAAMAARAGVSRQALAADPTIMVHGAAPAPVPVTVHRFHSLRIGPDEIVGPRLAVVPEIGGLGDGLVGADFIRGRRIWLSFVTGRLFIGHHAPH